MLTKSADGQRMIDERNTRVLKWTANDGDKWKQVLENAYKDLANAVNAEAVRRANEVRDDYKRSLRNADTNGIISQTRAMLEVPDAVFAELSEQCRSAMADAIEQVRRLLVADELDGPLTRLGATGAVFDRLPKRFDSAGSGGDITDVRTAISGGAVGLGAVALGLVSLPLTAVFWIGAGAYVMISRRAREQRRTLQSALDILEIVRDSIRSTAPSEALAAARETKQKLIELIGAGLAEMAAQVEQDRSDLAAADGLAPAERRAQLDEAEQALRDVEDISASGQLLRDELR